jgi:Predicted carboxypeptidase
MISARVHPGETPSSHVLKGLLRFLLDKHDIRAKAVRDNFVFVIIPILNPDGVFRGHYRADTHGLNLNRYYINPNLVEHPSIYGAKQVFLELNNTGRLFLYCDLHAHATKKGCFIFGNTLDFKQQVDSRLFPKLLSLNSEYFEYNSCCFSEKNLASKEKGEGKDKDGAGRVALYKATGLVNCYTLECNYNSGKIRNILSKLPRENEIQIVEEGNIIENYFSHFLEKTKDPSVIESLTNETTICSETYVAEGFEQIGEGIVVSVLDMIDKNPISRIRTSPFETLAVGYIYHELNF